MQPTSASWGVRVGKITKPKRGERERTALSRIRNGRREMRCWSQTVNLNGKLKIDRQLDDFLLNRPHHQLCLVVNAQFAHQIELVRVHGFHTQSQHARH